MDARSLGLHWPRRLTNRFLSFFRTVKADVRDVMVHDVVDDKMNDPISSLLFSDFELSVDTNTPYLPVLIISLVHPLGSSC